MKFSFELDRKKQMLSSNDNVGTTKWAMNAKASKIRALRYMASQKAKAWLDGSNEPFTPFYELNPCNIHVVIYSPTRRKYDPPNFAPTSKALIDEFTDAGIFVDDNYNIVKSVSFEHGGLSESKAYRIEIEIKRT